MADIDASSVDLELAGSAIGGKDAGQVAGQPALLPGSNPVVELVSPLDGIVEAATPVVLDIYDPDVDLIIVFVWVHYDDSGASEVVWTGDGFAPRYASSTRVPEGDGHRFTLLRSGGWLGAPDIRVKAVDATGGEA